MAEWSPFRAYGIRPRRFCWQDALTAFILLAGAAWLYFASRSLPGYSWSWGTCLDYLVIPSQQGGFKAGLLLQGLAATLRVGLWTFAFSLLAGGLAGLFAVRRPAWASAPYQIIINILRDTPPLILLFCVYFLMGNVLSAASLEDAALKLPSLMQSALANLFAAPGQLDRMISAVLALGLYQSAYVAEIIRGCMEHTPQGQWDSGRALGFSHAQTLRLIIFPQGLRSALAPLTSQCISTFKESALASLISIPDLTFQSLEIMAVSDMTFEVWICSGTLYALLGLACAWLGRSLERRCSRYLYS